MRTKPREPSPRRIVEGYLAGETEAVRQVDAWIESAARSFRRRLRLEWEDLMQDLRLEIYRLLERGAFRGESQLKTYLWRVVNRSCIDRIRAARRRDHAELDDDAATPAALQRSEALASWSASRDLLRRVLEQMSEECKQIWRMIAVGMSYREMSESLAVAEGTLRVRALRCREKARELRRRLLEARVGDSM